MNRGNAEKPLKDLIKEVVKVIDNVVSIDSVVHVFSWDDYPNYNRDTISTAMSDLAVNGPSSSQYKDSEKFLFRVERGKYRLYNTETDGIWEGGKKVPEATTPPVSTPPHQTSAPPVMDNKVKQDKNVTTRVVEQQCPNCGGDISELNYYKLKSGTDAKCE